MRIQATVLLLACCLWQTGAQNIWNNPVQFRTKANDSCTMSITGQREFTRLRMTCESSKRSYWCEYEGKPHTCRSYSKNPRHYFVQMMWNLRKLHNACQAPRHIKPHMCKKATNESQMVFKTASFSRYWPDATWKSGAEKPSTAKAAATSPNATTETIQVQPKLKTTQKTRAKPTSTPLDSDARRMARLHCWRSLQGICSVVIGWFQK